MTNQARFTVVLTALLLLLVAGALPAAAQWPQFGGPGRDFRAETSSGLAEPKVVWTAKLGDGESSLVMDDGLLYTMYRQDGDEVVVALKPSSGETAWEHRYAAPIKGLYVEHGDGPHATPLVTGDRIVTVGITGLMHALDKKTGAVIWSHDLMKDYGGKPAACGYGASPIAYKENVIVPVGGPGHGVVAFQAADGGVAWKSGDFVSGYAAPTLIDVGGQIQLVAFMGQEVVGLDPADGTPLWSHPHKTEYGVNASMPVFGEDRILFVSSAYDTGSRGLRLTRNGKKTTVEEVWVQRKVQMHFSNVIRIGDHVYGTSGGFGPVFLTAVDAGTGEIVWKKRDIIGKASMLLAGGKLVMVDEKGKLVVASVSPEGVEVHATHQIIDGRVWAPATLVGDRLYVRDRKQAYAFDLSG